MRTLAIGDIHGCLTAFDRLLAEVRPERGDRVITLGDYVDRGPDSKGVIDRLLELGAKCRLVALRGNHDFVMIEAHKRFLERQQRRSGWFSAGDDRPGSEEREWLLMGGGPTLASYGPKASLANVPPAHWFFLEDALVDWHETEHHFYVHANAYPDVPLAEQPSYMLHWEKLHDAAPHLSGKTMICGHTAQRSGTPLHLGCAICIDTWVYGEGWLTCLDVDSGKLWQTNQQGQFRTAHIDEFRD